MGGRIFVSYRRDDVAGDARSIRDRLARKLGEPNVFMDVDNLLAGQRFDRELDKALQQCDVLVAVIGPQWMRLLSDKTASGERDYVRDEIAAALKRDIVVIPALVGREGHMPSLPRQADLPDDIRDLVQYQKHSIVHESFGRNMDDLVAAIETVRRSAQPPRRWKPLAAAAAGALLTLTVLGTWFFAGRSEMPMLPWSGTGGSKTMVDNAARKDAEVAAKKAAELETKKRADEDARKKVDEDARRAAEHAKKKADEDAKRAVDSKAARDAAAECDRLAASPIDPMRPSGVPGVSFETINADAAWAACSTALRLGPSAPRLTYQAGRSANARKDFVNALQLYRAAASQGNAAAMNGLGVLYLNGDGVTKDEAEAKRWLEKAVELGDLGAMTSLGFLYNAREDHAEARKWYEKAAALGEARAMANLGLLYEHGQGVTRDLAEARKWYEKATALGELTAMTGLGSLAEDGRNYTEAKGWYERGAALGDEYGMFRLGQLYENGRGVPKNTKAAREWYQKAADRGSPEAKDRLQKLK